MIVNIIFPLAQVNRWPLWIKTFLWNITNTNAHCAKPFGAERCMSNTYNKLDRFIFYVSMICVVNIVYDDKKMMKSWEHFILLSSGELLCHINRNKHKIYNILSPPIHFIDNKGTPWVLCSITTENKRCCHWRHRDNMSC